MKVLKAIGQFFVKLFVRIGLFFKGLGLGIVHFFVNLGKSIGRFFRNFGRRFKDSSTPTKIGHFIMGAGNIGHKQYTRGIIYLLIEVLFFVFMIISPKTGNGASLGFGAIGDFFSLGGPHGMEVADEVKTFGDDYEEIIAYTGGLTDEKGAVKQEAESFVTSIIRTSKMLDKVEKNVSKYKKSIADYEEALELYSTDSVLVDGDYTPEDPDIYAYEEYSSTNFGSITTPFILWIDSEKPIDFITPKEENGVYVHGDFVLTSGDTELPVGTSNGIYSVYRAKNANGEYRYFISITNVQGRNLKLKVTDASQSKFAEAKMYSISFDSSLVNSDVDNSFLMMLFGVFTFAIIVIFILIYLNSIKSAYASDLLVREGKKPQGFKQDLKDLLGDKFHLTLLLPAIIFLVIFTIIPTVFMILISFTDFEQAAQMSGSKLINWVGLDNFISLFGNTSSTIGREVGANFGSVLLWTFVWAIIATFSCYFGGILLALLLNKKEIKGKKFWRTIFILTIAIPQFISLLVMRLLLSKNGPLNSLFGSQIDWLAQTSEFAEGHVSTGVVWRVRMVIIVVNLWLGIPYTMLMTSGILMNIPADLYEAATIDGANKFQMFRKITLPYVIFVTTPYLISSFIGNITSFNTIFLLTGGGPTKGAGLIAGETDLLVTWLYKLTITASPPLYNAGSVIGILTFLITSILTLIFYRNSKAYKEEDTFQ